MCTDWENDMGKPTPHRHYILDYSAFFPYNVDPSGQSRLFISVQNLHVDTFIAR